MTTTLNAAPDTAQSTLPNNDVAWNFDRLHSGIEFSVKHFFTPVTGRFETFDVDLRFDRDDPTNSSVEVEIDVNSITTGNKDRDAHLLTEDFFGADQFGKITFRSDEVEMVADNQLVARGPLTIKDVTRRIELPITLLGVRDLPEEMQAAFGGIEQVASFTSELSIDRGDYEVGTGSWAAAIVVGKEVDIRISVEANR